MALTPLAPTISRPADRLRTDWSAIAAEFGSPRGYLAAATCGIASRATVAALHEHLDRWAGARLDPSCYDGIVASSRAHYARIVGTTPDRVAIGSQTSAMVSLVATAAPDGAEIVVAGGDFSSLVAPFAQGGRLNVRAVPLESIADAISERTWLVAFSLVQSANGRVAAGEAIAEAAARHGALTLCDTTQAAGIHPVAADDWDLTVCHAYKWLCAPRGVAFLTVGPRALPLIRPAQAGWYAGERVWESCYGEGIALASDARRFDVSPAWQAWAGAEPALELFATLDIRALWARSTRLGDALCEGLGIAAQGQAIVTWPDADGSRLRALGESGIRASGRAGRLRVAFHLWNDERDVERVLDALGAGAATPPR